MIEDLGYKYTCTVCGTAANAHSLPPRWTKGSFVLTDGMDLGDILVCPSCYVVDLERRESGDRVVAKLWERLTGGKPAVEKFVLDCTNNAPIDLGQLKGKVWDIVATEKK